MIASSCTMQAAKATATYRTETMPFSPRSMRKMPAACMGMFAATSIIILRTGVPTSVSLFILVFLKDVASLLVSLVVLISLLLTCLTGLVGLESLVGLTKKVATRTVRGD
jgi:hypothetical protein